MTKNNEEPKSRVYPASCGVDCECRRKILDFQANYLILYVFDRNFLSNLYVFDRNLAKTVGRG